MKAVVAAFNQEKALIGAFSVITNLRMQLFEALVYNRLEFLLQPFETVTDGFETIPRAFVDMMDGASQGKVIVRV